MTCEDTKPVRLAWEIQLHEPYSRVWICRAYGRATTPATPLDVARAVLAGYLAGHPPRGRETYRALAHTDDGQPVTVTADQLPADGWTVGPAVRRALPLYLRDALAASPASAG